MKKILTLSLILSSFLFSEVIDQNLLNLKDKELEEKLLSTKAAKSNIINDINFNYDIGKSYFNGQNVDTQNFSINFSQDMFRSGGIFYLLQYNDVSDKISRLQYNMSIIDIMKNIITDKYSFEIQKLELTNNLLNKQYIEIEKLISEEEYQAGIGSFLNINNKIISLNSNIIQNNQIKNEIKRLKNDFKKYASTSIEDYLIPVINKVSLDDFIHSNNYDLLEKQNLLADKSLKLEKSKYLPKISVYSNYNKDIENNSDMTSVGLKLSMPLKLTPNYDSEQKKVALLKSKLNVEEYKRTQSIIYQEIIDTIDNYENNIALYLNIHKNWDENFKVKKSERNAQIISDKQLELFELQTKIAENNIQIEKLKKNQYIASTFLEFHK